MGRKVLMVGLGGTGCKAVARVRERVIEEHRNSDRAFFSNIAFVGIDTDLNATGKGTLPMVVTSRNASVADILKGRDEWSEWFPSKNNFLRARNMLRGAGQIRVLSRLALEDTLSRNLSSDDPLKALNSALDQLQQQDGDPNPTDVVVMIISSFAGGTGSGIFIQVALYLRNLIMSRLHCNTAIIRGLFTLPDIYVRSQHGPMLIENIYANAYASLKELCALNRLYSASDRLSKGIKIHFDHLFDSEEDREANGQLAMTKTPYNFIFFVDDTNKNGKKLSSIEAYEKQIADIAYMQLYSPMADSMYSAEDNQIRDLILNHGERIYGSAGYSRIIYPHDDIVEYCVKRMMVDSISSTWLLFDKRFREEYSDAQKRRRSDPGYPLPKIEQHYVNSVESAITNGSSVFPFLRDDIILSNEDESPESTVVERQEVFLENVKTYIKSQVNGKSAENPQIKKAATEAAIDQFGKKREDIVRKISHSEKTLLTYKQTVDTQVRMTAKSIMYSILPDAMTARAAKESYSLASLLYSPGATSNAVHPISARFLLYKLRDAIKQENQTLLSTTNSLEKKISGHLSRDWDEKKEGTQKPSQAVPHLRKGSFINQYSEAREKCYSNIEKYAVDLMTLEVFKACLERINLLIKRYETMFQCLFDIMGDAGKEISQLEAKHDINLETDTYVYASSAHKRKAYHQIAVQNNNSDASLYESILSVIYDAVIKEEMELRGLSADNRNKKAEEELNKKLGSTIGNEVRELFVTRVADTFRRIVLEDQSDAVNISIIKAIEKQCAEEFSSGRYKDESEPRTILLSSTKTRAVPFLEYEENQEYNEHAVFWGINDEAAKEIRETSLSRFFDGDATVVSNNYSPYEICCYRAVYSVSLEEIPKFHDAGDEPGIYYLNYENLRKKMITEGKNDNMREDALTPHIDFRWIDRAYLPMISESRNDEEDNDAAMALLLGCIYGSICLRTIAGKKKVMIRMSDPHNENDLSSGIPLLLSGEEIEPYDYPAIYRALRENAVTTDRLMGVLKNALKKDRRVTKHTEKGLSNPLTSPFTAAMIDMPDPVTGIQKKTNPLTILAALLKDDLIAEEEIMRPILQNALNNLINNELEYSREDSVDILKQLIYRNSSFARNPRSTKEIASNLSWIATWRPEDLAPILDDAEEHRDSDDEE